jgi:hypothetical protein
MVSQLADTLSMRVELSIAGRALKDLDAFTKSDPQCILYEKANGNWTEVGRTEKLKNTLNPEFKTTFVVNYFFEKVQPLKFIMIDGDHSEDFDVIGQIETTMGNIMGSKA